MNRFPEILPLLLPAAIMVIPYADLLMAVVRRTRAGQSPFAPDRKHLHHRLLDIGHSHRSSVIIMYLWAALFSGAWCRLSIARTPLFVLAVITSARSLLLLLMSMPRLRWWERGRGPRRAGRAAGRGRRPGRGGRPGAGAPGPVSVGGRPGPLPGRTVPEAGLTAFPQRRGRTARADLTVPDLLAGPPRPGGTLGDGTAAAGGVHRGPARARRAGRGRRRIPPPATMGRPPPRCIARPARRAAAARERLP